VAICHCLFYLTTAFHIYGIFSYHIAYSQKGKQNMMNPNSVAMQPMEDCAGQVPAMAYVPWQTFTKAYEPQKALMTGTIFPELDKPFSGKCRMMQRGGRGR
jgi:hypothetical protein